MAQTLIARIECSIYNINDYLVTCGSSYENYFKDRIEDAQFINIMIDKKNF